VTRGWAPHAGGVAEAAEFTNSKGQPLGYSVGVALWADCGDPKFSVWMGKKQAEELIVSLQKAVAEIDAELAMNRDGGSEAPGGQPGSARQRCTEPTTWVQIPPPVL